jgi:malate dehydrogenase (oxaloacetate-decarboxylating)(NADP+)
MKQLNDHEANLEKYTFLHTLQDTDEDLFFKVLIDNVKEVMPYVYTPTVGAACQNWGKLYRHRPRGIYLNSQDAGNVDEILDNHPNKDIKVVVVTDGERILGLGDLGINGMGIPIGKLSLYTACAGINPAQCLPVHIDVGTNNEALHDDPYYMGLKQHRDRSHAYYDLVQEFFTACQKKYGRSVLLQFEDFGQANAFKLLDLHKDTATTFNDDLQGTAGVVLAGFLSSLKATGKKSIADHRILFMGAGGAGIGIADLLCSAMMRETGCTRDEARKRIWLVDSKGLVTDTREQSSLKAPFAHSIHSIGGEDSNWPVPLEEAVKLIKPTALVGVSGQGGVFNEVVLHTMAEHNDHPLILALSNPTTMAECTSEEAYQWTDGKAWYASGSPMPPVTLPDGSLRVPGQGNNAFIFPGVGLAAVACGALRVTDDDFYVAALALANSVQEEQLQVGCIYPSITDIRSVSLDIAAAVAQNMVDRGDATKQLPAGSSWKEECQHLQYTPTDSNPFGTNYHLRSKL